MGFPPKNTVNGNRRKQRAESPETGGKGLKSNAIGFLDALDVAINTAKELGDVFAYEPPGRMGEEFKAYRRSLEERGRKLIEKAAEKARRANVPVETALVPERPSEALAGVAEEKGARFLIVGTYGESPLRRAILGSVPHKLLQIPKTPSCA